MNPTTLRPDTSGVEGMNAREKAAGLAPTPGYRYADQVGDQLFVAGQVPLGSDGDLVGRDDPAAQAAACLDNLRTLLDVHAFGLGDIRHLTIYVVGERQHLRVAWRSVTEWFAAPVPPATLLGVNLLGHSDQLVEVDAIIRRHPDPGAASRRRTRGRPGCPVTTSQRRACVTAQYCRPWCRPQENFSLSVSRQRVARSSEHLQRLLGYSIHPLFMGFVRGMHLKRVLSDTPPRSEDCTTTLPQHRLRASEHRHQARALGARRPTAGTQPEPIASHVVERADTPQGRVSRLLAATATSMVTFGPSRPSLSAALVRSGLRQSCSGRQSAATLSVFVGSRRRP